MTANLSPAWCAVVTSCVLAVAVPAAAQTTAGASGYWQFADTFVDKRGDVNAVSSETTAVDGAIRVRRDYRHSVEGPSTYELACRWTWRTPHGMDVLVPGETIEASMTLTDASVPEQVSGWQHGYSGGYGSICLTVGEARYPSHVATPTARNLLNFSVGLKGTATQAGTAPVPPGPAHGSGVIAIRATCGAAFERVYEWRAGQRPPAPAARAIQPTPPRPAQIPCDEARLFYDDATLEQIYRGGSAVPSMVFSRLEIVAQFEQAVEEFRRGGGVAVASDLSVEAPFMAARFVNSAMPTGREGRLKELVSAMHSAKGARLTPGDLFLCALRACNGDVRDALVTCHATLYRAGDNKAFVDRHLVPLTRPDAFNSVDRVVPNAKNPLQPFTYRVALDDQQGHWYHLFGMAAVEYQDQVGVVPFSGIRLAAEALADETSYVGSAARFVGDLFGVHSFEGVLHYDPKQLPGNLGTQLSRYAIGLENNFRSRQRRAPDPEKQCYNFAGIAVARSLRLLVRPPRDTVLGTDLESDTMPLSPAFDPYKDGYEDILRGEFGKPKMVTLGGFCAATIRLLGEHGEQFTLDQEARRLRGNTLGVVAAPIPEVDGSWGCLASALFPVAAIEVELVRDGEVRLAAYDHATGRTLERTVSGRRGDVHRLTLAEIDGGAGQGRPVQATGPSFAGDWDTSWGVVTLRVDGERVSGSYPHDGGRISGVLSAGGRVLTGTWSENPSYSAPHDAGSLVFTLAPDGGSFQGLWWYGARPADGLGGREWNGTRAAPR